MSWRAICDRCGSKRWNHQLRLEWTGLRVCSDTCWEPRQPQDRVRGKADKQNPPWVRPEPEDVFLTGFYMHEDGRGPIFLETASGVEVSAGLRLE